MWRLDPPPSSSSSVLPTRPPHNISTRAIPVSAHNISTPATTVLYIDEPVGFSAVFDTESRVGMVSSCTFLQDCVPLECFCADRE